MSDIRLGSFTIYHKTNDEKSRDYEEKYFEETSDEIIVYEDKWGNEEERFPKSEYKIEVTEEIDTTPPPIFAVGPGIKSDIEYEAEHLFDDFDKQT